MISYYELLGLIKEKKQPDKVKYIDTIYEWDGYSYYSEKEGVFLIRPLQGVFTDDELIKKQVIEIIEEKPKKIEQIAINDNNALGFPDGGWTGRNLDKAFANKINKIIEKVNYLLEDKHAN